MSTELDPARAALVVKEYRYATMPSSAAGATIKARYPNARVIELDTNLDATGGLALATDIAGMTSTFARTFTFDLDGVYFPEDFQDGAPRHTLDFPRQGSATGTFTVVGAKIDYQNNLTTLTVRAS